jgi:hypothetical protein
MSNRRAMSAYDKELRVRYRPCVKVITTKRWVASAPRRGRGWAVPAVLAGAADEFGGGFGSLVGQAGQHVGVGVGGEHDALV